jgi:hypothetical protein
MGTRPGCENRPGAGDRCRPRPRSLAKECALFMLLAFGISWLIWILAMAFGAGPGKGEAFLAFGSAGPAIAAILLSRSGQKLASRRLPVPIFWFAILWVTCWAVYIAADKIRGVRPNLSLPFGLTVGLLAVIPTGICSGAFSRDSEVRNLLATLVLPQNWRWPAVAFFSFPAILLFHKRDSPALRFSTGLAPKWRHSQLAGVLWARHILPQFVFHRISRGAGLARVSPTSLAAPVLVTSGEPARMVSLGVVARASGL